MASPNRAILSFVLIAVLISVMLFNEKVMLKNHRMACLPISINFIRTFYLLNSRMDGAMLHEFPTAGGFVTTLWLTIPVLVFSFNHSPAISSFTCSQFREYKTFDGAERHIGHTEKRHLNDFVILRKCSSYLAVY